MRKGKMLREDGGFWSAVFVLVLTALAALGFSTYTTVRNEGSNAANQVQMLMTDFAATSGAYMGVALYGDTTLFTPRTFTIAGINVSVSIAAAGTGTNLLLTSSALSGNNGSAVQVTLINPQLFRDYEDLAILTTSTVEDVDPEDSTNTYDETRMKQLADSIPTMNLADMIALSNTQGHTKVGNWTAPDDWPGTGSDGSFYNASGDPNVTYVMGNMTMSGNNHAHGIFIVTGTLTLNGSTSIDGVIYLPNVTSSIIHGSGSTEESIDGGIISHGNIKGTGSHVNVANKKSYLQHFYKYRKYPPSAAKKLQQKILSWTSV